MAPYSISVALAFLISAASLDDATARRLVGNRFHHVDADDSPHHLSRQIEEEEPPTNLSKEPDSLIAQQFTKDPYADRDRLDMILTGELGLAGLRYMPASFSTEGGDDDSSYSEVYGEFCAFQSTLNKSDPSYYPTIKHVLSESSHCGEHRYSIPLREVMEAVESYGDSGVQTLPLSGMLFHQGYSGAGLISNALSTLDSTLVVSEHSAIHDALSACDAIRNRHKSVDCSSSKQQKLVQDIITLISRTTDKAVQHLFLKLDSASAAYLPVLRDLYPDAKWTFSYRNAEETLSKNMQRKRSGVCAKAKRNPSSALNDKTEVNHLDLEQLSHHEVCALHLATLWEAAARDHESSGTGMLVSYDDILSSNGSVIVDEVLPYLGLQGELDSDPQVANKISEVLSRRSNSWPGNTQWDPSQEANIEISEEVHNAVKVFMGELMG